MRHCENSDVVHRQGFALPDDEVPPMRHTMPLSRRRRSAMLLPVLTLMLAACGGSSLSNSDNDTAIEPGVFSLEEATVADIHAAFRGELLQDNGEPLNCEALANLYIQRIFAYDKTCLLYTSPSPRDRG